MKAGPLGVEAPDGPLTCTSPRTERKPMDDDSRDLPEPQVSGLGNGCLVLFPCNPGGPVRAPPRAFDIDQAARALVAKMPLVAGELRRWRVPEREVPDLVQN